MQITQIFEYVNGATQEATGGSVVVAEDLSNIVETGEALFNANAVDKYVKALVNRIGKVVFVNRAYGGFAPDIMMDKWEFGSVLQKVSGGLPEATVNESYELEDGQSYDPNIFHKPKDIVVKFFNKYVTFEVDMSFVSDQVKMSFTSASEMDGFISMLYTNIENSMTIKLDMLKMATINNMTGETIYSDYATAQTNTKSGVRAINLLYKYNQEANTTGTDLTADNAMTDMAFLKYAAYQIKVTHDRMRAMSRVYNIGGQPRHTPTDRCKIVMHADFAAASDVYLQSDTFHNELSKLPSADRVPYWQGSGTGFEFDETSKISVTTSENHTVVQTGILCVMFDRYALGVVNTDRKVTSDYNAKADFFTNFYKYKAEYFNDLNENFVLFFIA